MKLLRLIFGIFAVIGLGLLAGAIFAVQHTRHFIQGAVSVPAVVTENVWQDGSGSSIGAGTSGSYYPRVLFHTTDGQEISLITKAGSSPPAYHVQEQVTVLYDPTEPHHASIRSFGELWLLPTILAGMGIVFCSFGAVAAVVASIHTRKDAWLRQNGQHIQAELTRVELNTSLTVNGSNPYHIVCQWLDPARNQMHVFKSANIWFDPTNFIPGKTLEVLIDPNNPHRYLVETSFLPKVV